MTFKDGFFKKMRLFFSLPEILQSKERTALLLLRTGKQIT